MNKEPSFRVLYLDEAAEFLKNIDNKVATKLLQNIDVAARVNDPKKFKKLQNSNIWEFRCEVNKLQYRLFAFWDTEKKAVVVATHGMIKKTQKTPLKEIEKAEKIRLEYLKKISK